MKSISFSALLLAIASSSVAANSMADEMANTLPSTAWTAAAELGILSTSGNTVGTSVTGKIEVQQQLPDWINQFTASVYFKDDEITNAEGEKFQQRSAERYAVSAKSAYKLGPPNSTLFVLGSHVDDTFGAFEKYSSLSIGHGLRWYESENKSLDLELGPGYFHARRADDITENGLTLRAAAAFQWQLSASADFSQTLSVERSEVNTHSKSEAVLSTRINSSMQMKAAFIARSDSEGIPGRKKTDTQTSLTLAYAF
jgi:putative salt-induced outer membrane protein